MQDLTVQLFETAKQLHATKARQSYSSCQWSVACGHGCSELANAGYRPLHTMRSTERPGLVCFAATAGDLQREHSSSGSGLVLLNPEQQAQERRPIANLKENYHLDTTPRPPQSFFFGD